MQRPFSKDFTKISYFSLAKLLFQVISSGPRNSFANKYKLNFIQVVVYAISSTRQPFLMFGNPDNTEYILIVGIKNGVRLRITEYVLHTNTIHSTFFGRNMPK